MVFMDKVMKRFWWLAGLLVSCTKPNPSATCSNGTCSNPDYPYCDADGAVGGEPNTCLAVSCTAGDFGVCDGDATALMCNAAGNGYDVQPCDHACQDAIGCIACAPSTSACVGNTIQECGADGRVAKLTTCSLSCVADPAPHCAYISPRYLPDVCDALATDAELHITSSGTIDTDAQTSCNGGVVPQSTGPSICVMRYGTITIDSGATLSFIASTGTTGTPGNLLAMVADGDLTIHGTLDIGARSGASGPGGGDQTSGGGPANLGTGGGGAGFKNAGAAGGSLSADGGAQNGGSAATMDPSLLASLVGGSAASGGGGGGGAATLVSCRGAVVVDGKVASGGGGGRGGFHAINGFNFGGAGGGAGGYVVFQG